MLIKSSNKPNAKYKYGKMFNLSLFKYKLHQKVMLLLWFYVVFEIYHVDDSKQCDMYATYEATRVPPHALTALTCHSWGILSKNCSHVTF